MYCTYYISSVLICICTINKDYYCIKYLLLRKCPGWKCPKGGNTWYNHG